jgi:hypothetical protein
MHEPIPQLDVSKKPASLPDERPATDDHIDLRFLIRALLRGLPFIIACMIVSILVAIYLMRTSPEQYEATMTLQARSSQDASVSGFGLSAALTSIGFLSGGKSQFDRLEAVLGSPMLAGELERRYGVLHTIYKGNWNEETQSWYQPDSGILAELRSDLFEFLRIQRPWSPPDTDALRSYIKGQVEIEESKEGANVLMKYKNKDKAFAEWFLTAVFEVATDVIREREIEESERRKQYLYKTMETTRLDLIRQSLATLVLNEEQKSLLLLPGVNIDVEVIVPAKGTATPVLPSIAVNLMLPIIIGIALSVFLVLIRFVYIGESNAAEMRSQRRQGQAADGSDSDVS